MLDGHNDFERMLNKYLPAKSLNPTMTIIENMRIKVRKRPDNEMINVHSISFFSV